MNKDIYELFEDYEAACNMTTKPSDIMKLKSSHIEDENKSVKWNKDFIENNNKKYLEAVAELQRKRSNEMNRVQKEIEKYIQKRTGINSKGAKAIFNYAYEQGHSCGICEVRSVLFELCDLFEQCKK